MSAVEPRDVIIPGLLAPTIEIIDPELGDLKVLLAWKRVRSTSTGLYAVLQDSGILALGRKLVLNATAAIYNADQRPPTSAEVHRWLAAKRRIVDDGNFNRTRPRFTELSRGWTETRTTKMNGVRSIEKVFVPCDILVAGPRRKDDKSGISCITWHVREFSE